MGSALLFSRYCVGHCNGSIKFELNDTIKPNHISIKVLNYFKTDLCLTRSVQIYFSPFNIISNFLDIGTQSKHRKGIKGQYLTQSDNAQ